MNRPTSGFLILCLALLVCPVSARQSALSGNDSLHSQVFPLPILFYTPETGVAGGAAALYLIRNGQTVRPSNLMGDIIYTERKRIIVEVDGDLYFEGDSYRLLSTVVFQKYPNKFFGIGNFTSQGAEETYTPQSFVARAVLYRKVYSRFNIGPLFRYETVSMKERDPAGLLATGSIPGSNGGNCFGVGVVANWDSRDNTFAANNGSFYQLTALFYQKALGGDYTYNDIQVDTRNFFELLPGQVLAVQAAAEFIDGTPPFQSLVQFGGQNLLRGYFAGRYRDKDGVAVQAEYRVPVWWRLGLVGFGGIAQVAPEVSHLAFNRFWFAGGLGLRFFWNPEERISLRLDYGMGNNSSGVYITVTEAF